MTAKTTKSVLIVDDDRALVQALMIRCRTLGLAPRPAFDGMQAYDAITQDAPDLLIVDVDMPAVNGLYLCDELARDHDLPPIPTIVLTGRVDDSTLKKCANLGVHHVWKGLETWDRLYPVICELLELSQEPAPVDEPEQAEQAEEEPVAEAESDEQPAPVVLVVDDDPGISEAIKVRLKAHGVEVLRAYSGMQGYWMALKRRPDVIIADYTMPEGHGNWLLARLKNHSITTGIPVVILTGRKMNGQEDYALKRSLMGLGAAAYITKPFETETLLDELKHHIRFGDAVPHGSVS